MKTTNSNTNITITIKDEKVKDIFKAIKAPCGEEYLKLAKEAINMAEESCIKDYNRGEYDEELEQYIYNPDIYHIGEFYEEYVSALEDHITTMTPGKWLIAQAYFVKALRPVYSMCDEQIEFEPVNINIDDVWGELSPDEKWIVYQEVNLNK